MFKQTDVQCGQEWFAGYCEGKRIQHGAQFDPSDLAEQFIPHKARGETRRIHVQLSCGEKVWGYVDITTGSKPVFLLMRRRGQRGSSIILRADDRIIAQKDVR